jgi:hypothetical protein
VKRFPAIVNSRGTDTLAFAIVKLLKKSYRGNGLLGHTDGLTTATKRVLGRVETTEAGRDG